MYIDLFTLKTHNRKLNSTCFFAQSSFFSDSSRDSSSMFCRLLSYERTLLDVFFSFSTLTGVVTFISGVARDMSEPLLKTIRGRAASPFRDSAYNSRLILIVESLSDEFLTETTCIEPLLSLSLKCPLLVESLL